MLKYGVNPEVDELAKGSGLEWSQKIRKIDRDADGYASYEELSGFGWKWNTTELTEAGYKEVTAEELAKAGWKMPDATFGEGGFATREDQVMLKYGVDDKLDAFIKGEEGY